MGHGCPRLLFLFHLQLNIGYTISEQDTIYILHGRKNVKKVTKINLRVISKCHAHLQSLTKTPVKFQKDWEKIVGGVALTKYLPK